VEKNLKSLRDRVLATGAHLGIGFDGDADRIGVVDENGKMIFGDELMVIISRAILSKQKGAKIIGDVKCSDRLFADIQKNGGEPILWKTGHSLIKEKIKVEKAPFGGEMSGHIFFADRNYGTDDALYAALRICEILSDEKNRFSHLLQDLPASFNTPEIRIDTTEEKKISAVQLLREKYSSADWTEKRGIKVNFLDGVRISYPDGWALVRSSNTQPVLVMRFEASTSEGLQRIRQEIESLVSPVLY
jgi:phosphomannomutase/phosphomannomutase/phosphoglucomutase